ncbi:MAG: transporter substrate-binding domain-containing protein [Propionibacteriaceae bacterium]|jgi:polar amino acid transport system substrate-binding protein|nr:transporter substrate-binding domain-containing protein [Propionibacteriaceae bacterium]
MRKLSLIVAAALALGLAGCGAPADTTTADNSGAATTAEGLTTITAGKLTIGTGEPAYEPWVLNDDPTTGEGFEAAVAYAVADKLGFAKADVVWVRTTFEEAIQPGPKNFDFNLQQYSITEERTKVVDFSPAYYKVPFVVVTLASNPFASATTVADLKGAKFGCASGDVAYDITRDTFSPTQDVAVFNDLAAVTQALNANQIDAFVIDVPTADYLVGSGEVEDGKIVGAIAGSENRTDGMALLLEKDSPLTSAVTDALNALTADGTIAGLENKWLGQYDVPVLKQ